MLIDTHKAVRDLTEVGVPQEQAERLVDVVTRADEKVATKADLDALEERLGARIDGLGQRFDYLRADFDGLEESLRADFDGLEESLRADFDGLEERLGKRMDTLEEEIEAMPSHADLRELEERMGRKMWRANVTTAGFIAALLAVFEFLL